MAALVKPAGANRIHPLGTANEKRPSQNDFNVQTGRQKAKNGEYAEAIQLFNQVKPPTYESLYYRGCTRLEMGDAAEAINDFDQAIELSKRVEYPGLYYKRAFACHLLGRHSEAIQDYTMFIKWDKRNQHKGYLGRGLVYHDLFDYDEALTDIQEANRLAPEENIYYQYCLKRAQSNRGLENDANGTFEKLQAAVAKSGGHFEGYFHSGVAFYDAQEYEAALKQFDTALLCSPTAQQQAETRFYIGLTRYSLGQISQAKEEIEQTVKMNEKHGRALFRLGLLNSEDERSLPEAVENLSKAHALLPHKSDILYERGEVYYRMGKLDASMNDKRQAMQMKQFHNEARSNIIRYELLLQRILVMFPLEEAKDDEFAKNIKLIEAILHDKLCFLSRDENDLTGANKHYHQAMKFYQSVTKLDEEDEFSLLSFALMFNLSNKSQRPAPALIAIDQFHDILDKNGELWKKFQSILDRVRQEATTKTNLSSSPTLEEIVKLVRENNPSPEHAKIAVFQLLIFNVNALEKIADARSQIQRDLDAFRNDPNRNRAIFYRTMRVRLSHTFAAMAVTSGVGDDPIIRHDRTGTQSLIGDAVKLLGSAVGGLLTTGGGVVAGLAGFAGGQIQEQENAKFRDRMSMIAEFGTIEELTDVARRIARQLAEIYQQQLLCLVEPDPVEKGCCSCLPSVKKRTLTSKTTKEQPPADKGEPEGAVEPCRGIVQFGVSFLQNAVLTEKSEEIGLKVEMEANDLVNTLVRVICRATPGLKAKALSVINMGDDALLSHTPINSSGHSEQKLNDWRLHEFYVKPAIRLENEETDQREKLSWTNADLYGHRLGTLEEYQAFLKTDQKQEKKKRSCC